MLKPKYLILIILHYTMLYHYIIGSIAQHKVCVKYNCALGAFSMGVNLSQILGNIIDIQKKKPLQIGIAKLMFKSKMPVNITIQML